MLALIACLVAVAGGLWIIATGSWALLTGAYVLAGVLLLAVICRSFVRIARVHPTVLRTVSLGLLPVVWYAFNVAIEPLDGARRQHQGELVGAVIPGLVLGYLIAAAIVRHERVASGAGHVRENRLVRIVMGVSVLWVGALMVFLAGNVADNILLISAALLPGAESYQTLGDLLTVNLIAIFIIERSILHTSFGSSGGGRLHRWMFPTLLVFTTVCGILLGSNKLLLAVAGIGLVQFWQIVRSVLRRPVVASFVVVAVLLAVWTMDLTQTFVEVIGLTRLLDYGTVSSVWDIPSVSSRLEIAAECGAKQLALAPLVGDLAAEYRTCGEGNYLHSIVSIQTHLGMIGSALLVLALMLAADSLRQRSDRADLAVVAITIGVISTVSAFFTWMPLWCVLGMLSALPPAGSRSQTAPTSGRPVTRPYAPVRS